MDFNVGQLIAGIPIAISAWFLKDVYVQHKDLRKDHEATKLAHATQLENHEVRIGIMEDQV